MLGIIGIGIIGKAIASVLISTDIDRRVSTGETVLRSYVAAIEGTEYIDCASADAYSPAKVGYTTKPNTFEAEGHGRLVPELHLHLVVDATDRAAIHSVWLTVPQSTCPGGVDPGLQLITVEVKSTGSRPTTERITFVKQKVRDPAPRPTIPSWLHPARTPGHDHPRHHHRSDRSNDHDVVPDDDDGQCGAAGFAGPRHVAVLDARRGTGKDRRLGRHMRRRDETDRDVRVGRPSIGVPDAA